MNKKRKAMRKELFVSANQNKPSESKAKEWYKKGGHLFCGQQNEGQNKQDRSKPFTLNVLSYVVLYARGQPCDPYEKKAKKNNQNI